MRRTTPALRDGLEARGIAQVIAHNPRRRGLGPWQKAAKFVVKTVRSKIEPVFGTLKRSYGLARARGFFLARNPIDVTFRILAFDLHRVVTVPARDPTSGGAARSPLGTPKMAEKAPQRRGKSAGTPLSTFPKNVVSHRKRNMAPLRSQGYWRDYNMRSSLNLSTRGDDG